MTRYRGTLVRPLADQADRDGLFIDPAGVEFEGFRYPVTVEFDYDNAVGTATVEMERGALVATLDIDGDKESVIGPESPQLAVGIAVHSEDILPGLRGRVVSSCRLNAIGLTARHADPGQPPIEEVP